MTSEQPRAYNYVASQDFSANASAQGQTPQTFHQPPSQYHQAQQSYVSDDDTYRPSTQSHSYYPPSGPLPQPQAAPPPVNYQSRPHGPAIHTEGKPPPQQYQGPYQPVPFNDPNQQWGQMSFDEKFRPQDDRPKWNDVSSLFMWLTGRSGRAFCSLRFLSPLRLSLDSP